MNLLNKTNVYLAGPMQYQNGRGWREDVAIWLSEMGIKALDPYNKPFLFAPSEAEDDHSRLYMKLEAGDYEAVHQHMKEIIRYDLACVDRSDFILTYIDPTINTIGTINELSLARSLRKPVFIVVKGGIKKCPLWLLGMFKPNYFYSSFEEVKNMLTKINDGETLPDSSRWRLLKPHLR